MLVRGREVADFGSVARRRSATAASQSRGRAVTRDVGCFSIGQMQRQWARDTREGGRSAGRVARGHREAGRVDRVDQRIDLVKQMTSSPRRVFVGEVSKRHKADDRFTRNREQLIGWYINTGRGK